VKGHSLKKEQKNTIVCYHAILPLSGTIRNHF
jgi:hypothetical protein